MSNVAPCEVMCMTAKAFGLLPLTFRGQFLGNWKSRHRPKPLRARQVAVYLILRHTQATNAEIAGLFGHSLNNAKMRTKEQADLIAEEIKTNDALAAIVDGIEDEIDALHDDREGKGALPVVTKKRSRFAEVA